MRLTNEAKELLERMTKGRKSENDLLTLYDKKKIKAEYWQGVMDTVIGLNNIILERVNNLI